jgi:hypothetical protein
MSFSKTIFNSGGPAGLGLAIPIAQAATHVVGRIDDVSHVASTHGTGYDDKHAALTVHKVHAVGAEPVFATDKFLLAQSQEMRASRAGPTFTHGQPVVYTSGRRPYLFIYSGSLLISRLTGDGRQAFQAAYDTYLRASAQLVGKARVAMPWMATLTFRDRSRTGYLTSVEMSINSLEAGRADLNFAMFVINESS